MKLMTIILILLNVAACSSKIKVKSSQKKQSTCVGLSKEQCAAKKTAEDLTVELTSDVLSTSQTNVKIPVIATFSSDVSDFTGEDVSLTNASLSNFTGSGKEYSFNVVPTADGEVSVLIAADVASNEFKKKNLESEALTFKYDATSPIVSLSSTATSTTSTSPIPMVATFSEEVTGFDISDLVISNGAATNFSGSGLTYTFDVVPSVNGLVTVDIPAASATDTAGNPNAAALQLTRTYDSVFPAVTITSSASSSTKTAPIPVTVTFSKVVTGFDLSDVTVGNGTGSNFSGSGTTYTLDVTPTTDGSVTVDVASNVAVDVGSNANTAAAQLSRIYDTVHPTVTLSSTSASTVNSAFTTTATFSESVTGFTLSDITVGNGTASSLSGSGTTYTFTVTPTATGSVTVDIAANVAADAATNNNTVAVQLTRTYDHTAPTVSLTSTSTSSTNTSPIPVTATFSESVTGFTSSDITVTNGTAGNFSGTGTTYTFDVTPTANGAVNINIAANVATDSANNGNTAATQLSRTYDTVAPTVTLTSSAASSINAAFSVIATFSESVTGFTLGDITVGNGAASSLSGSGTTYTFTVTPTADGSVTVDVASNVVTDAAGNNNTAATQLTRTYDQTSPSATLSSAAASTLNAAFDVTATFSESVTGFALGDITVGNGTASSLSGSGTTYTFTVTPTADGSVSVDVASNVATDGAGNGNTAAAQLTRTYDHTAPTVALTSAASATTNSSPFSVTATFSESVTGFALGDITVGNGSASNLAGAGTIYTFDITPSSTGAVTIDIAANVASDTAGNDNTAATQLSRTYDNVAPAVTLTSSATATTNSSPIAVTATFSKSVTGFAIGDITVGNGSASNFSGSGTTYTFDVTPTSEGSVTVDVAANVAQDNAGNNNTAAAQLTRTYDITAPTVSITSTAAANTNTSPIPVTVTFSESVTGFVVGDLTIGNGSASSFSGSGTTYTFDVTPTADGIVTVDVAANRATDAAGNNNTAAAQLTRTYDHTAPTVSLTTSTSSPTNSSTISVTATFSESVTGFAIGDITVGNGSASNFAGTGTTYTFDVTPTSEGAVTVNVAANTAQDVAGNNNSAATQLSVTYDSTAPTVTLTSSAPNPTNSTISVTATFSESVTGFTVGDITVGNGTAGSFSGSGTTYTFVVTASGTAVTVDVAANVATDSAGNNNTAATQLTRTYDATQPTVALTTGASSPTSTAMFTVTATFSESVTGFAVGDITVSNGTAGNLAGTGTTYTFDVTATTAGAVTVEVGSSGVVDGAGNSNTASNTLSVTYDNVVPTITLSSSSSASLNTAFSVTATFSESVTGFAVGDITVGNGSASNFAGSGASYTFDVTPTADGSVTIDVNASVAVDSSGNNNTAATQLSRTFDGTAPTVSMTSAEASTTRSSSISVTVTTSESTTTFTSADLTLTNATVTGFTGSGTSYSFNLIPSSDGTVAVDISAGVFTDAAGNTNTAATQFSRTVDRTAPTIPSSPTCTGSENSVAVGWTTGGGDTAGFLVVRKYGASPTWTPTNGTSYSTTTTNNLDDYTHWLAYAGSSSSVTETDVYPGMSHNYAIFAYDSLYNYQSALTVDCIPEPMVILENRPAVSYSGSTLNIKVSGQAVAQYQYAVVSAEYWCDEVGYSGWTSVSSNITDTVYAGPYRVCVKGKTSGGITQTTASETYFVKTSHVSIDHPNVWGSKVQQGDNYKIEWTDHNSSDDVSGTLSFYYATSKGANCSSATTIATGVSQNTASKFQNWDTTGVATGVYYVCIESYDGSSTHSFWANGSVEVENYCTGSTLTNTLASGSNGAGSSGDPYNICTLTQLDEMMTMAHSAKYYKVRRDIDASSTSSWNSGSGWLPRSVSMTTLDGNGYSISGLFINRSGTNNIGMFSGATSTSVAISNLRLTDVNITGGSNIGAFAGVGKFTFSKVFSSGSITGVGNQGGIAGYQSSTYVQTFNDVISTASITSTGAGTGGIVGSVAGTSGNQIRKAWFKGSITSSSSTVGGIAGTISVSASDLLMTGSINTTNSSQNAYGGLFGATYNTISLSRLISAPSSLTSVGNSCSLLAASINGNVSILGVVTSGTMTCTHTMGGFFSYIGSGNTAHIIGSSTSGNLTGTGTIGGMLATSPLKQSWIYQSYATGSLTSTAGYPVGGIFSGGTATGVNLLRGVYSSVAVSATNHNVGGLVGHLNGTNNAIVDSYFQGSVAVTAGGNYYGGLVGLLSSSAKIVNSYNSGNVTAGGWYVGGLGGGCTGGSVSSSFSIGTIGTLGPGGIFGYRSAGCGAFSNVYWYKPGGNTQNCIYSDGASSGTSCSNNSSTSYFQNSSNAPLSSWDFTNFWKIPSGGGYPILSWQNG